MTDKAEDKEKATKIKKIRMAIWMFNRLIDTYPEIYEAWRREYERRNG